ncbi:MAG: DUF4167 domain-containing protein [Proteobacteria bacterium]|nr:DUF4167 domain-containing protein [Pseudomonadota bacterium]
MKQGSNNRRSRSRGGNKRHSGGRNNFESNGPEVKIRGTAQQVQEKYLALARDANVSGDWVSAEAFFQFAEHYYRISNPEGGNGAGKGQNRDGKKQSPPAPRPADQAPAGEAPVIDTAAASLAVVSNPESVETEKPQAAEITADDKTEPSP